jgi:hypothetical protein
LGGLSIGLANGLVQSGLSGLATIPGAVALLLFFVFTYLYSQSRADYFRAWQIGWAAYSLYYGLDALAAAIRCNLSDFTTHALWHGVLRVPIHAPHTPRVSMALV